MNISSNFNKRVYSDLIVQLRHDLKKQIDIEFDKWLDIQLCRTFNDALISQLGGQIHAQLGEDSCS